MKKYHSFISIILITTLIITSSGHTNAFTTTDKSSDFYVTDGVLLDYYGDDENVIIPSTVTEISSYAFEGCNNIKKVTIPTLLPCVAGG